MLGLVAFVELVDRGQLSPRDIPITQLRNGSLYDDARLQAISWVDAADGTVLRQDMFIANSRLRFNRVLEGE